MIVACASGFCHSRHLLSGIHLVVSADEEAENLDPLYRMSGMTGRGVFMTLPTLLPIGSDSA